jgi:hypothetical protein
VRRLARDLPAFESVWVDALVQRRRLTPFQARWLTSPTPERLLVGPCVLVDRLWSEGDVTSYLARRRGTVERCTVTVVEAPDDTLPHALERFREFLQATRGLPLPQIGLPWGASAQSGHFVAAGPYVAGPTLQELLVRRGRFSPITVADIAAQLSRALATLERAGVVHGDVRLRNARLTNGGVMLLDAGVRAAVSPELTIHARLSPEQCDGIAPERIGTGQPASVSSDLYALGCLLWQLLAARPPFPTADPLAKLAAHQTQAIADVRVWAPDTPSHLAETVAALTAPAAPARPASFFDVQERLNRSPRATKRRLMRFARALRAPAPATVALGAEHTGNSRRTLIAAGAAFCALSLTLLHSGARTDVLSIAASVSRRVQDGVAQLLHPSVAHASTSTIAPYGVRAIELPAPDASGTILLESAGPYAPRDVAAPGSLVITAAEGVRPVIRVADQPLRVWAQRVLLGNVTLTHAAEAAPGDLLVVESHQLFLDGCRFESRNAGPDTAIHWRSFSDAAPFERRLAARNCAWFGPLDAFRLSSAAGRVQCNNALKVGPGPLLTLDTLPEHGSPLEVELRRTTLRGSGGLLQCALSAPGLERRSVAVTAEDCVFDPLSDWPLVEFRGAAPAPAWERMLEITGEGNLVRPNAPLVGLSARDGVPLRTLDPSRMSVDGLLSAEFSFKGPESRSVRDSEVDASLVVGRSLIPPGIDVQAFPPLDAAP